MLFVRYSQGEEDAFFYFQRLATDSRKLPREWKRLLNYHRLVWYIFSVSKEAKTLAGWQVQLITWIFVSWEWQENMNLVIEKWKEIKWKEIKDLKTSESNEPSLLMIIEHLIEEHERENQKMTTTGKEEEEKLNENIDDTSQKLVQVINKLDALEKSLAKLKKEMKKLKEPLYDELKEEKKEKLHNLANWKRMKSTLERYDVSMDGIQAFQRFRFYCIAGYLPCPLLNEQ